LAVTVGPHDCEIVAWRAITGSDISGDRIRDMILIALETHVGIMPPQTTPETLEIQ
jgi:hypothetical protein